jgi:NADH-quinone oxidoreductase subunit J
LLVKYKFAPCVCGACGLVKNKIVEGVARARRIVQESLAMILAGITAVLAALMTLAALASVFMSHPVRAVLALIGAFTAGAGLCTLFGADFLAMVLMVVYVGAVAVLFLFVLMMLDLDAKSDNAPQAEVSAPHSPFAIITVAVFAVAMGVVLLKHAVALPFVAVNVSIKQVGAVLYTQHFVNFQVAGLILMAAMVGAIVLTLRHRGGVKKQNSQQQVLRQVSDSLELVKIAPNAPLSSITMGEK